MRVMASSNIQTPLEGGDEGLDEDIDLVLTSQQTNSGKGWKDRSLLLSILQMGNSYEAVEACTFTAEGEIEQK